MLNETELRNLMRSSESHWVERKKSFQPTPVKQTIVAFANTVPEGQHAVLFIGIAPDGNHISVENADETQRKIRRIAEDECFPPVQCTPTLVRESSAEIIAVVVKFSSDRPHFAGHAFIRVGSETLKASPEVFNELIASRSDKVRRILREKGGIVTTIWKTRTTRPPRGMRIQNALALKGGHPLPTPQQWDAVDERECRIESCDSHLVRFHEPSTSINFSASLENVKIDYDDTNHRMKLIIDNR